MYKTIAIILLLITTSVNAQVDPRLRNIGLVIEKIDKGKIIEPLRVDIHQYIYIMGIKSLRKTLKKHMVIVLANNKQLKLFNGVLPKKIELPFYELIRMYQKAYAGNKKITIDFLKSSAKPMPIPINKILYRYTEKAPFSQVSLGKMLKDLKLESLSADQNKITLMQLYFAIGGSVKADDGQDLLSYKLKKGQCFVLPPKESICIKDQQLANGVSKALSANVGVKIFESKSKFNKKTKWRVAQ